MKKEEAIESMHFGVDIDGTIKDTHRAAVEVYNKILNRSVRVEDVTDFYLDRAFGLTREEGYQMWREWEEQIYSLGVPLEHAPEVLTDLVSKGHRVTFITARPDLKNIEEVTRRWLKKHGFPYTGDNLVMNAQDKAKVAKEMGVDLFFEDAPYHLENLVRNQIPTVIVDASYNQDFPHPLKRIRDWREVYAILEDEGRKAGRVDGDH